MSLKRKKGLRGVVRPAIIFNVKINSLKSFFILTAIPALAHTAAAAVTVARARVEVPPPAYADGESSSATEPVPVMFPKARIVCYELSLDNTAGGGAELRLGNAKGGRQPLAGTVTTIGFEDGAWFIRGGRHRQNFTATNAVTGAAGARSLAVRIRLAEGGAPVRIERLEADGKPLAFEGLDAGTLKAWLDPRRLYTFRAVSRGGAGDVSAAVRVYTDGSVIIVR